MEWSQWATTSSTCSRWRMSTSSCARHRESWEGEGRGAAGQVFKVWMGLRTGCGCCWGGRCFKAYFDTCCCRCCCRMILLP
jgi:hypothetical protein